jgi:hypothetical protein
MTTHTGPAQDAPAEVVSATLPKAEPKRLHFSLFQEAEQTTFVAGLRSRIFARVTEALHAPTAAAYMQTRDANIQMYAFLTHILREETARAAAPMTDEQIVDLLGMVEGGLGETRRHQLEQAINTSHVASRMAARLEERASGPIPPEQLAAWALHVSQWMGGWMLLGWTVDCILLAVDPDRRVTVETEVVEKLFETLDEAATGLYVAMSALYDLRVGAPKDDE